MQLLFAAYEEEVRGDGSALEVFCGVPGGAVGIGDGDEIDAAEGAYVVHPDIGVAEAVAAGAASQFEGFGDVIRRWASRQDARFRREAVDGDLDAFDGRLGKVIECKVKTLRGTCLFGIAGAHDLAGGLTAGEESYGASRVGRKSSVVAQYLSDGEFGNGKILRNIRRITGRLGEGEGAGEEERDGKAAHTNLLVFEVRVPAYIRTLLL